MRLLAAVLAALWLTAVAAAGGPAQDAARFLLAHRQAGGGFAEPGGSADPSLSAWVALGLAAAGVGAGPDTARLVGGLAREGASATDVELAVLGVTAAGGSAEELLPRLRALVQPSGAIGPSLNSTIWGAIALAQAGEQVPAATVRYLLARQTASGGWSWAAGVAPDSNDTAATIEALRAAGVAGAPIRRGVAFLRRLQAGDGGFELTAGRGSDAQSTAWAVQALLAAGERPGRRAYAYLAQLRRPDGSYRYSERYAVTPVWVTSQVLAALAGRPFPLR